MSDTLRPGTNTSGRDTMAALSLTCKQCNASLKSVKEAQDHGEATGHSQFEESTEPVSHTGTIESGIRCISRVKAAEACRC